MTLDKETMELITTNLKLIVVMLEVVLILVKEDKE